MISLRVLLVSPHYRSHLGLTAAVTRPDIRVDIPPLALAVLVALAPPGVEVDVWDECTQGPVSAGGPFPHYDFVGVSGYSGHLDEALRVAAFFRGQGVLVGVGGPGASIYPEQYRAAFDVLFIGEAEEIWPAFLRDLATGVFKAEYRQIERPDLSNSVLPDWSRLDRSVYGTGAIQTSRGCPFDCSFCDVIYLFGRAMRHRPIPTVLEEVKDWSKAGFEAIFFSDDEFVGDRAFAKELLRALAPVQQGFARPMSLLTQSTVNAARDEELMRLLADAGFAMLFVGIESIVPQTLKNIGKLHNLKGDPVDHIHRLHEVGIAIRGNTIVGFDEDEVDCFDRLFQFHQAAQAPFCAVTVLMAPHGTPLWAKLREEGRLVDQSAVGRARFDPEQGRYQFNLIPLRMSRVERMEGYRDLLLRLYEWQNVVDRTRGYVSRVQRVPALHEESMSDASLNAFLAALDSRVGLDAEGRKAIIDVALHTRDTAPFLWQRVKVALSMQVNYRHWIIERTGPALVKQIAYERHQGPPPAAPASRPPVPRAFRMAWHTLLPPVVARASLGLIDLDRLAEVVTSVFVQFLQRWGATFEKAEPHHPVFLAELTDRAVTACNLAAPDDLLRRVPFSNRSPHHPSKKLGDEIVRNIDIELGFH